MAARNLGAVACGYGRCHWCGDGAHLGLNKRLSIHDTTTDEGTRRAGETDRTLRAKGGQGYDCPNKDPGGKFPQSHEEGQLSLKKTPTCASNVSS
jgi:hypothetical protein